MLRKDIDEKVIEIGEYVAATGATVRSAADKFGISKSTVHKYLTSRLKRLDAEIFNEVSEVLAKNRAERHIRGGMATKAKYFSDYKKVDKNIKSLYNKNVKI